MNGCIWCLYWISNALNSAYLWMNTKIQLMYKKHRHTFIIAPCLQWRMNVSMYPRGQRMFQSIIEVQELSNVVGFSKRSKKVSIFWKKIIQYMWLNMKIRKSREYRKIGKKWCVGKVIFSLIRSHNTCVLITCMLHQCMCILA